jgi:hypothetical protein
VGLQASEDRPEFAFRPCEVDRLSPASQSVVVNRRSPEKATKLLKVVAFNAKGGCHLEGIRQCLTRPPLAQANVILVCDADWCLPRSGFRKVAAELAASLEMSFAYVPKRQAIEPGSYSGNAILSSQPLVDVVAVPLSKPQLISREPDRVGEPYGMMATTVYNGSRITFGVTHLTARWNPAGRGAAAATAQESGLRGSWVQCTRQADIHICTCDSTVSASQVRLASGPSALAGTRVGVSGPGAPVRLQPTRF